ncbi:hypothetical protein Misp01_10150 [Microtetraspora sp. NBRC 13810]|uniref:sensor histidine kinase n=1 Tax=Microtetraspora sp. NBRC 13810 TaxID=3030990 RepID=UPI00249FB6E1|nr:histidine kinase [Microtetraspora sp. NBRC 13810]GLW05885.1 hypothetical protein Misp01_10150 [Microtetraspora sp. NBRC 13810]
MSPLLDRIRGHALAAVAFCAAFVPAGLPGVEPRGYAPPGFAALPVHVQCAVAGVLAAAAATVAGRRQWPLFAVAALDVVLLAPGLLCAMASYVAATTYRRPRHLVIYTAVASLVAVVPRPGVEIVSSLGAAPLFVWLPLTIGLWVAARRQVLAGLRERAERLEREQTARADRARAEERARIARDMHDVVAHRVSLMVLRAGALEINAADEKTAAEAELIRTTGKEALTQLRAVLGVLASPPDRHPPHSTLADLDQLLDQSRSAGVPVERRDEGEAGELPAMVQHAVYRVVQESLTNIHKHAGTVATEVVLRHLPTALEVTVGNAPGDAAGPPGGGLGLIGLRERVELLGGEFTARPRDDGGFVVSARLPT